MLRYADDVVIRAQDEINLKRALDSLGILKRNYKKEIKRIKTEVMVCSKDAENIKMDEDARKQVPKFKYLGSIFTEDGGNKEVIIQRDKEAKVMFNNKKQLLCLNNLSFEKKKTCKKLHLECCCLWIRNMNPRKK